MILLATFIAIRAQRSKSRRQIRPMEPPSEIVREPEYDPFALGSATDKRGVFRRKGNPVKVAIRGPGFENDPMSGVVVDRSHGGVALFVSTEFPNGTLLWVRPEPANETSQWVELEVRSSRPEAGEWLLGCKFVEIPPWSLLLQFG